MLKSILFHLEAMKLQAMTYRKTNQFKCMMWREVLTYHSILQIMQVFWGVTRRLLVYRDRYFEGPQCLHLQSPAVPKDSVACKLSGCESGLRKSKGSWDQRSEKQTPGQHTLFHVKSLRMCKAHCSRRRKYQHAICRMTSSFKTVI